MKRDQNEESKEPKRPKPEPNLIKKTNAVSIHPPSNQYVSWVHDQSTLAINPFSNPKRKPYLDVHKGHAYLLLNETTICFEHSNTTTRSPRTTLSRAFLPELDRLFCWVCLLGESCGGIICCSYKVGEEKIYTFLRWQIKGFVQKITIEIFG